MATPSEPVPAPAPAPGTGTGTRTKTIERTDERTRPVTGGGDHDRYAHIIRKRDEMRGYVMGEEVVALCGKRWVPSRDPKRYPICPTCKELLAHARGGPTGGDDPS